MPSSQGALPSPTSSISPMSLLTPKALSPSGLTSSAPFPHSLLTAVPNLQMIVIGGRAVELGLSMISTLPLLRDLRHLDIKNSYLGVCPEVFQSALAQLTGLTHLDLGQIGLGCTAPRALTPGLGALTRLRFLRLVDNELKASRCGHPWRM